MIQRHSSIDPVHPGEILREDVLPALSMSKTAVAEALGISKADALRHPQREATGYCRDGRAARQTLRQWRQFLGQLAAQSRSGGGGTHSGRLWNTYA